MIRKYTFAGGHSVNFEDSRSVQELIQYAFDVFDFWEPMGMDKVTLFQAQHPQTNTGWFTTDVSRSCAEEILNPQLLCFAYHVPDFFYYAEGGWGHHMASLGNHPQLDDPVMIHFVAPDFQHTLTINGNRSLMDVIHYLQLTDYLPASASQIRVHNIVRRSDTHTRRFSFTDPLLHGPLSTLVTQQQLTGLHFIIE